MVQQFRALDLKSGGPGFKPRPQPRLYMASWFASRQLGFLTCYVQFDYYLFPVISEWNVCKLALGS